MVKNEKEVPGIEMPEMMPSIHLEDDHIPEGDHKVGDEITLPNKFKVKEISHREDDGKKMKKTMRLEMMKKEEGKESPADEKDMKDKMRAMQGRPMAMLMMKK